MDNFRHFNREVFLTVEDLKEAPDALCLADHPASGGGRFCGVGDPTCELARIMHETPSRDRGDGRATGQPQGLGPEAYLFSTAQGSGPEDAREDGQIRGGSRCFVHNAG